MRARVLLRVVLSALGFFAPTAAFAEEESSPPPVVQRHPFGAARTLVLDDLLGFGVVGLGGNGSAPLATGWIRISETKAEGTPTTTRMSTLALAPSVDLFVAERFSLGGQLTVFHSRLQSLSDSSSTGASLRPRIGWVLPLNEDLSLWPRAFGSVSYTRTSADSPGPAKQRSSQDAIGWGLGIEALLAASIGRSLLLTFGPTLAYGKVEVVEGGSTPAAGTTTAISLGVHGGISLVL